MHSSSSNSNSLKLNFVVSRFLHVVCVYVCVHATSFFLLNVFEWVNVADELEYKKRNKISQKKIRLTIRRSRIWMNWKWRTRKKSGLVSSSFLFIDCRGSSSSYTTNVSNEEEWSRATKKIETFTTTTKKNLTFNITSISCWYLSWSRRPPPLTKAGETQTHSYLYIFRFFLFR